MLAGLEVPPEVEAERVITAVLAGLRSGAHRGIVVDSPPGAGKSTLVVRAAVELAAASEPLILIAQTNEQVDHLIDRLLQQAPEPRIGRLSAADRQPSELVKGHETVRLGDCGPLGRGTDGDGRAVEVGVLGGDGSWPWAIVDEAYQMRSDVLLRVAGRSEWALFVGGPGQLNPLSTVDIERWAGLTWDLMQLAVAALLRHNRDLPVHRLPVSWRLPPSAAPVVAEAFYPFSGLKAGTTTGERSLSSTTSGFGHRPFDAAVETATATGWPPYELPARHTLRTDAEAVAVCAALACRLLDRGAVAVSERKPGGAPISPEHRVRNWGS